MKRFLATFLFLPAAIIFFGCAKPQPEAVNSNSAANSSGAATRKESADANVPATEKVDADFVESESGTERAKPEAGKASVQGKVFYNEKPAEGVEVKICETFDRFIGGCGGGTFKTKTDANGEYVFSNIKPGVYEGLLVRVFDGKSYVFATKGIGISSAKYKFEADKTFFAPDTNLFKDDLKIQFPKANAKADAKDFEVKWDAYPDAAYYKLTLTPEESDYDSSIYGEKVEGTSYKTTKNLKSGKYTVSLEAYNATDKKLAEIADPVEFTITGGAGESN